jgi:hypothetical protein
MQMISNEIQKHQEMINVTVMEKNIVQSPLGSEVALFNTERFCTLQEILNISSLLGDAEESGI